MNPTDARSGEDDRYDGDVDDLDESPEELWQTTQAILLSGTNTGTIPRTAAPSQAGQAAEVSDSAQEWFSGDEEFADEEVFPRRHHHVTAVVVSHDGARWLPVTLATLAAQERPCDLVFGVDTGSKDNSLDLLEQALGSDQVLDVPRVAPFGSAVAMALKHLRPRVGGTRPGGTRLGGTRHGEPVIEWLWLLHDDSAPTPGCLDELLATADANPSASVLGPKVRGWHDRRMLLEVGVSVTASGTRYTGLERGEHDQGQHDGVRDVLSVSSAGLLIQVATWERLGGFDPAVPLFRDDLDLCWRARRAGERVLIATNAVIHHREASANGQRTLLRRHRPHREDREAAAYVLLTQASGIGLILTPLRILFGAAGRSIVYLLGKDVRAAQDEASALLSVVRKFGRLRLSRRRAARTATEPPSAVAGLRPTTASQVRDVMEIVTGVLTTSSAPTGPALSALESGPTDDESAYLDSGPGWIRRALTAPAFLMTMVLIVLSLIATRAVLFGDGVLQGGGLLPSPPGVGDLWGLYQQGWHNVGPGSATPAPPYLMVLAAVAVPLLGKPGVAVTLLMVLAMPLAGLAMWWGLRGVIATSWARLWAAAAYATLPVLTGAISAGRIGTCIAAFVLPFAARSFVRIARPTGTLRRAAGSALLLSVLLAVAPLIWLVALVCAIAVSAWTLQRSRKLGLFVMRRMALAVFGPLLLTAPWSLELLRHPGMFFLQPGVNTSALTDPQLRAWDVLFLHPGGPGMTPLWVSGGILLAALVALLRRNRRSAIVACWGIGLLALALGTMQTLIPVAAPGATIAIPSWPGPATLVLGGALAAAGAFGGDGLRNQLRHASFTLGQPALILVAALAVMAPLLSIGAWLPDGAGLLRRASPEVVPAFVAADALSPQAPRTLVLRQDRDGGVRYWLVNGSGPTLGDADVNPGAEVWSALDPYVAALASGRGGDEVSVLAGYGVRYVLLAAGSAAEVIPLLDGEPGLRRLSSSKGEVLWTIEGVTARARQVTVEGAEGLAVGESAGFGTDPYLTQTLPNYEGARQLVIGELADDGWRAAVVGNDGALSALPSVTGVGPYEWSQTFAVPSGAPRITVWFDDPARGRWIFLQFLVLLALVILALPTRRTGDLDPERAVMPDVLAPGQGLPTTVAAPVAGQSMDDTGSVRVVARPPVADEPADQESFDEVLHDAVTMEDAVIIDDVADHRAQVREQDPGLGDPDTQERM